MSDVSAFFGILIALGIAYPGMLTAWWLLFPATVERARLRLEHTPWRCFWLGGVIAAVVTIPTVILLVLPFGPAKFISWTIIALILAFSTLGAAGMVAKMGERLAGRSNSSAAGAFVRGAVALELAIFFPVLGWAITLPLVVVTSLGAAGFALLHWAPKKILASTTETIPAQA